MIKQLLKPDLLINELSDIDLQALSRSGIKCFILDVDNTFIDLNNKVDSANTFLQECAKYKIKVHLLTNNFPHKVKFWAKEYNLSYTYLAFKPLKFSYSLFFKKYPYKNEEVIAIGDQIFTDVLGAKRCGLKVYFLNKKHVNDFLLTKILRPLERKIIDE